MTNRLARLRRCERGATAVEFSLVGLIAIILLVGIIEFGRGLYMRNEMYYAMDVAERMILTNPAVADAAVETALRKAITFESQDALEITFGSTSVNGVPFRTMLLRYPIALLIPGLTNRNFMLRIDRIVLRGST